MKNVRKKNIKLIAALVSRTYLVSGIRTKLLCNKFLSQYLLSILTLLTNILEYKPVYLGLSILEISTIAIHEFWYDYVESK